MDFYWIYDLPRWLFGCLSVGVFIAIGLAGLYPSRKWVRRVHQTDHSHNDIVGFYLAAVTVFYGITLGLLAVGSWTGYSDAQAKVDHEAEVLSSFYRDVSAYPEPFSGTLKNDLQEYTRYVIDKSWPQQRMGIIPTGSDIYIAKLQNYLLSYEPGTPGQQILAMEAYKKFNELVECRRARLNVVTSGIPESLWALVILGALVTIAVTLFFDTRSFSMHFWMTVLISGLLGLMIFLVATLDHPFRGRVSIKPQPLELVYTQWMNAAHVSLAH